MKLEKLEAICTYDEPIDPLPGPSAFANFPVTRPDGQIIGTGSMSSVVREGPCAIRINIDLSDIVQSDVQFANDDPA